MIFAHLSIYWKTPLLSRLSAGLAKKPSTVLAHEHDVGVQWQVKRL